MVIKVIVLACVVGVLGAGFAFAQADGPAELPASDYPGQSYVDSKGCIFLKAAYGGAAEWSAQVGPDRKPICGLTPTNAVANVTEAAATVVPAVSKPRAKKRVARASVKRTPVMIGCPVSVPVARRYATTDGGSVVVCTAKNGSLTGARSPIYPPNAGVGAALSKARYPGVTIPLPGAGASADQVQPLVGAPKARVSTQVGGRYVQVGAFGQPSNADAASGRLIALGMPVSKAKITKSGQSLQVIYAGPFSNATDVQAALNLARLNGFSDAYIR